MTKLALAVIVAIAAPAARAHAQANTDNSGVPIKQTPELKQAAREAFGAALAAESAGKLAEAARQYHRAIDIAPHPNAYYNLADVERRMNELEGAVRDYQKYLELAPDAVDRGAILAMIDQLQRTPGLMMIKATEPHAQAWIDGVFAGDTPINVMASAGRHQVDVFTPITAGDENCGVSAGGKNTCSPSLRTRRDGNVFISGPAWIGRKTWNEGTQDFSFKLRFTLAPGNYTLYPLGKGVQCDPTYLLVPPNVELMYYYVNGEQPSNGPGPRGCVKLTVQQHSIKFKDE